MVGLAGIIGDHSEYIDNLDTTIATSENEYRTTTEISDGAISYSVYESYQTDQPIQTNRGHAIWIWGEPYGFQHVNQYKSKQQTHPDVSYAEYVADLYERYDEGMFSRLNGQFAGVIDREDELWVFVDRLSTRPIYWAETTQGDIIFSSSIHTLVAHSEIDATLNRSAVAKYFASGTVHGTQTIFSNINQIHPGSILKINQKDHDISNSVYWRPIYTPKSLSAGKFAKKLANLIPTIVREQTGNGSYGILLSGGSDSRLLIAASEKDLVAYHMNEWRNQEAQLAEHVADQSGTDFRFLQRSKEYYPQILDETRNTTNLNSWFQQGHAAGFQNEFEEHEGIICGQYSDTILDSHYLPKREVDIPVVGRTTNLPIAKGVSSLNELREIYSNHPLNRASQVPPYMKIKKDLSQLWADNIQYDSEKRMIRMHGVEYPSIDSLLHSGAFYPITNVPTYFFYESLVQIGPTIYPFFDNRIVNLSLQIPRNVKIRNDIVNKATTILDNNLASIPHSNTGLQIKNPYLMHYTWQHLSGLHRQFQPIPTPEPYMTHWAQPDFDDLIRATDFIGKSIEDNRDLIKDSDFLDEDLIDKCYYSHMGGENNWKELFGLVSFLESPLSTPDSINYQTE